MTILPAPPLDTLDVREVTDVEATVGFNVAPSYFRANVALIKAGPAKIAERRAVEKRLKAFNDAVRFHRESIDALFRLKAMDATGQLVAGKKHYEVHVDRAEDASDNLLDAADDFIQGWSL